jgi:hypothetical protein
MKKCACLFLLLIIAPLGSAQQQKFRSGLFLHHSTGYRIWGPNESPTSVPAEIDAYNRSHTLTDSSTFTLREQHWPPTPDNEWSRWHAIFDNAEPDADIRPVIAANKIVMIKSCFPSSQVWGGIGSAADTTTPLVKSIANYKWHWRNIVNIMKRLPDNFFVIWTNAPLAPGVTTRDQAALADKFCRWAKDTLAAGLDPACGPFPKNVYVFDVFHLLAGDDGILPMMYAVDSTDSHPNRAATLLAAPILVREIFDAAIAYEKTFPVIEKKFPLLTLPYSRIDMGIIPLGQSRDTVITIGNAGTDTLKIADISSTGNIHRSRPAAMNIPPGGVQRDTIRFTPASLGTASGMIIIASNDAASPDTVTVVGTGTGTPVLTVGNAALHFGMVAIGEFKDTTITIGNAGTDTLRITAISSTGSVFSARPSAMVIAPRTSIQDTVFIKPDRFGSFVDSLIIRSDGGVDTIELSGASPFPIMVLSDPSIDYGKVRMDSTAAKHVVVTNASINTLRIDSLSGRTRQFAASLPALPILVSVHDTLMITLRFTPDSAGAFADTMCIYSNQQKTSEHIGLIGRGTSVTSVSFTRGSLPDTYALEQNFPNPFNPSTTVRYAVPMKSQVRLQIINVQGQLVAELVNGERSAGWHEITWSGGATGLYFYRLEATAIDAPERRYVSVRKMLLLK